MYFDFFKYYFIHSTNQHGIHSPFIFDFYRKIIKNKKVEIDFTAIENLRKDLKNNDLEIAITDFGAGVKGKKLNARKISDIAQKALKKPKYSQLLYRIVRFLKPKTIIDLGTSLGITTAYFAKANPEATIFSFEGCPNTANIAKQNFKNLGLKNIEVIVGNLDNTLRLKIDEIDVLDFAFFDANHRYEPTIDYFNLCLKKINDKSVFIFDDIYWSEEMKQAWVEIKAHSKVKITVDLFFVGIVFFKEEQAKEDFILRF
jgi:predicted O-methyltransferase YrrM